jgi:cardiolipin synthase A/B
MRTSLLAAGIGAALVLTGCRVTVNAGADDPPSVAPTQNSATQNSAPLVSSSGLTLIDEPSTGMGEIYRLITSARHSVDLTMYELRDDTAEADLAADAARGVDVSVLLDSHLEQSRNTEAYDYLKARHVHVNWASSDTTFHQKTLTVDGTTSVIMTLNMVTDDYPGTRDFAVVDTNHADVAAIVATFNADFNDRSITPPDGDDLVWSPTNSQASILAVIDGAKHTLAVENEEMDDPAITSALADAARRGVKVTVVMTADSEWDDAFSELARAGASVHVYPDDSNALYIHAKAVVADAGRDDDDAFVGSENFSTDSLGENRELGLRTANRAIVSGLGSAIASDYAGAPAYTGLRVRQPAWPPVS